MTEPVPDASREGLAAFLSFARRAARWAWAGGIVLALGIVGTVLWVRAGGYLYRSETVVAYERGVRASGEGGDPQRQLAGRVQEMLKARRRVEAVIGQLKLYPDVVDQRGVSGAVDEMSAHLTIVSRDGSTFRVAYTGETRDLTRRALEALVASLIDEDTRQRQREAREAKEWIEGERMRANGEVKAKETALDTFLVAHPELAGAEGSVGDFINRLGDGATAAMNDGIEAARLEVERVALEDRLAALRRGAAGGASADPPQAGREALAARDRARADVEAALHDLADKRTRLTDEHPDVKVALRRVADAEAALGRVQAQVNASRSQAPPASAQPLGKGSAAEEAALQGMLAAMRDKIAALRRSASRPRSKAPGVTSAVGVDTEWARLNHDLTQARARQSQADNDQFRAEVAANLAAAGLAGRLVVIDPASRPTSPVAGNRGRLGLLGATLSLFLALAFMALLAVLDDRLYGAQDVKRVAESPIVVVVSKPKT